MNITDDLKTLYRDFKKPIHIALALVGVAVVIVFLIALFIYNNHENAPKRVTYQYKPINACNLLTMSEAHKLLGKDVIGSPVNDPAVSGDVATSSCSYTDQEVDRTKMKVAALSVLSAVNDKGVAMVKSEFTSQESTKSVESIKDLGDAAYFNHSLGQLNILNGKSMLRISYGVGASPETNDIDQAVSLAHDILHN